LNVVENLKFEKNSMFNITMYLYFLQ